MVFAPDCLSASSGEDMAEYEILHTIQCFLRRFSNLRLYMTRSLNKRCLVDLGEGDERNVFSIHRSLQVALRLGLDRDPQKRREIFNPGSVNRN